MSAEEKVKKLSGKLKGYICGSEGVSKTVKAMGLAAVLGAVTFDFSDGNQSRAVLEMSGVVGTGILIGMTETLKKQREKESTEDYKAYMRERGCYYSM